jgi:glycosyltransferase involved in cell wall biosynthesis
VLKILLIGNYLVDGQHSMARFAEMLERGIVAAGHEARVVFPKPFFGRLAPSAAGLGKWLGYLDKFLVFPRRLRRIARDAGPETVFHVCDHSNAMYGEEFTERKWMLTCHDLLAVRSARGEIPEKKTGWTGRILQEWISRGIASAPLIACVSETTRRDVERLFPEKKENLRVVLNGLNFPYRPMEADEARPVLEKLFGRVPGPFLLHVGAEVWYKNRGFVPAVFAEVCRREARNKLHLVMVGPETPQLVERIAELGLSGRVRFFQGLEGRQLNALYSCAEALVFPSLAEGFGWPVVEAMASGCPVATTKRPPMSDLGEGVADFFDPNNCVEVAERVAEILREPAERRRQRILAGLERARDFSAERMVEGYLGIYRSLGG